MKHCLYCGQEISDESDECIYCGGPTRQPERDYDFNPPGFSPDSVGNAKKKKNRSTFFGIVIIGMGILLLTPDQHRSFIFSLSLIIVGGWFIRTNIVQNKGIESDKKSNSKKPIQFGESEEQKITKKGIDLKKKNTFWITGSIIFIFLVGFLCIRSVKWAVDLSPLDTSTVTAIFKVTNTPKPIKTVKPTSTQTPKPTSTQTPIIDLLDYSIYKDNSTADYGAFKVMWDIIITSEEITKPLLENLMKNLFNDAYQLLPGKNDDRNQLIFIYIYASKEHAVSGMGQWIGMVSKYADSSTPHYSIDELALESINATPENKLGLTELERKEIWNELIHIEDRSFAEAERRYPDDYFDYAMELQDNYLLELAQSTGLTLDQLDEIGLEGAVNNWPFPTQKDW